MTVFNEHTGKGVRENRRQSNGALTHTTNSLYFRLVQPYMGQTQFTLTKPFQGPTGGARSILPSTEAIVKKMKRVPADSTSQGGGGWGVEPGRAKTGNQS